MKQVLMVLSFVIVLSFTSCRRTFNCVCTTVDSTGSVEDLVIEEEITNSKSTAKDLCESGSTTFGNFTTTCVLD